jgi:nucleotide-binding universal stress UspA family protein
MLQIQKILMPTDFSPAAVHALQWAADLARQFQATLLLLHVVPPSAYPLHNVGQLRGFPDLREEILKRCREELQTAAKQAAVAKVETKVLEGVPHAEIVEVAAREKVSLIVMGTHGHTGLKHVLLGSVAERVLRAAPVPVLTVRGPAPA